LPRQNDSNQGKTTLIMENKSFLGAVAQRAAIDNALAGRITEALSAIIAESAAADRRVAIPGFGTFAGVKRNEEIVENPATGGLLLMPPSLKLEFYPSSMMKKATKGGAS